MNAAELEPQGLEIIRHNPFVVQISGDRKNELFPQSHFLRYSGRMCKVWENTILGLLRAEMVRETCFHIEKS